MLKSAARVALPGFNPEELRACIEKFVALEAARWLPRHVPDGAAAEGASGRYLYLRPTMIGTGDALGVQKPSEALLFLVAVCFPPLDEPHAANLPQASNVLPPLAPLAGTIPPLPQSSPGSAGMRLLASSSDSIRAWPGGFGNAKVGANYGPSLVAQGQARARGYNQILWLFGDEAYVTEAGGSNFMVIWRTRREEDGGERLQLVTAPLGEGVILEGVTRGSVLELVRRRWGARGGGGGPPASQQAGRAIDMERVEMEVLERRFTMDEIVAASDEGRLLEAFACGTAFFIAPVAEIRFRDRDVVLPLQSGVPASYATTIKRWLSEIMFGVVPHEWAVVVDEGVES